MVNNNVVQDVHDDHVGSIKADGRFYVNGEHLGCFTEDRFLDSQGLIVAFVDRTLSQDEPPTHQTSVSPLLANAIKNWSNHSWSDYLSGRIE